MDEINILSTTITSKQLTITVLLIFFIFYSFYKNRINVFILSKVDNISLIIILILTYLIIFNIYPENIINLISSIIVIFLFLIGFLQYRRTKESEIINKYFESHKDDNKLEKLIIGYQVLAPILTDQRNFITLLHNEVSTIISNENFDDYKKGLKNKILLINKTAGNIFLISLLKENKLLLEKNKNKIKVQYGIEEYNNKINRVEQIIQRLSNANEKIFKPITIKEKIITFLKP